MPDLKDLKKRLKKLPKIREQSRWAATYGKYTKKLGESREKMKQIYKDIEYAEKVSSSKEYKSKVLSELEKAVRVAQAIQKKISGNQESVPLNTLEEMEDRIVRIGEIATIAKNKCREIWDEETRERVEIWEKIAGCENYSETSEGQDFKEVVERLREREIPQNKKDVEQINADIKKLEVLNKKLGHNRHVVRFLNDAMSEEGASLKDLLEYDEIREKLDKDNLWDSLRIKFKG
jgi:hypothetical protein|tara:strand:- start:1024 stop:1725 length:702 start_codon:yes stop_codon:yes gene_type:complete